MKSADIYMKSQTSMLLASGQRARGDSVTTKNSRIIGTRDGGGNGNKGRVLLRETAAHR